MVNKPDTIQNIIILTPGEEIIIRASAQPAAPQDRVVLPVPWLSQWASTARHAPGDCGSSCVAMTIHYLTDLSPTVDEISLACQVPAGARWTSLTQLARGARAHGLKATHVRPLTREKIEAEIQADRPVITLVKYDLLPDNQDAYRQAHFVLIVGYDDNTVIFHDPDRLSGDTFGEFRECSWTTLLKAMGSTSETQGNSYNNYGLLLDVR